MLDGVFHLAFPIQALIAALCTWTFTATGACVVFLIRKPKRIAMDAMLGMAGGIMLAAAFFSLLAPAIEMANNRSELPWLLIWGGFALGAALLLLGNRLFERMEKKRAALTALTSIHGFKQSVLLIFSITLQNIPEGLAIGVAFGSLSHGLEGTSAVSAWLLALGIGLQNLPEGMAVSMPLRREGYSAKKAFLYGQVSGMVEPIAAVIGAVLAAKVFALLPFLLSFAAGAMLYVVVETLIPESQRNENKACVTLFTLMGFSVMMLLEIILG